MMNEKELNALNESELLLLRRQKLMEWRREKNAFPTDFKRNALSYDLLKKYENHTEDMLEKERSSLRLAGRIMTRRLMGKASFIHIQDMSGKIQVYVREDELPSGVYEQFKHFDLGDIVGVAGHLFKTKTGELSIRASDIRLLVKSMLPLPDKYHGLHDQETRYRQRYLDLIANEETRIVFQTRSKIIGIVRHFLIEKGFLEVETPMMHVLAGGAIAKPFITHHHALDMPLYLRVAPELYLKRLVVGGFEKVFEINRSFRNEGLSTQHNPEFTMLEFYEAYADYHQHMDMTEALFRRLAEELTGQTKIIHREIEIDFAKPFVRETLRSAVLRCNPSLRASDLEDQARAFNAAKSLGIEIDPSLPLGKILTELFDHTVEHQLMQPTFITEYPAEVSPLARKNSERPFVTDRFELFIGGREIANGFNELNDPIDQAERFQAQMTAKVSGDEEAMPYDEDYICALEHGLPPTAGEGIGIDRLVMLFTDSPSIRDVILFPHMRKKIVKKEEVT